MASSGSMVLIFTALVLLVAPGVVVNNMQNSNLLEPTAPALVCPGWPDLTCQNSVPIGCGATSPNTGACTPKNTVSFLNINSPFTSLLTLNLLGFFSQLLYLPGPATVYLVQPQVPFTNSTYGCGFTAGCGRTNQGVAYCFAAPSDQDEVPNPVSPFIYDCEYSFFGQGPQAVYCSNFFVKPIEGCMWFNSVTDPFNGDPSNVNATSVVIASIQPGTSLTFTTSLGYGQIAGETVFTSYGNGSTTTTTTNSASEDYLNVTSTDGFKVGETVLVNGPASAGWETNDTTFFLANSGGSPAPIFPSCPETAGVNNGYQIMSFTPSGPVPFNSSVEYRFTFTERGCTYYTSTASITNYLGLIGFIVGAAILVVLAIGLSFQGGDIVVGNWGLGANEQGTRFAQVVLILGFVIWVPLYSEFSTWFTSSDLSLPYGLGGSVGILSIFITGTFWFGLVWRAWEFV